MPVIPLTATIVGRTSLSDAVDYGDNWVVGLIMPTTWTLAHVTVQVSLDNIDFFELFNRTGTTATEFKFNVAPGSMVAINPNRMLMGRYLKLRSGTRDAPVLQPVNRIFTVITKTPGAAP